MTWRNKSIPWHVQVFVDDYESLVALPIAKHDYSREDLSAMPKGSFIGDIVRISGKDSVFHTVSVGDSREFCCGQHADNSRIEARAGYQGIEELMKNRQSLQKVSDVLHVNNDGLVKRVSGLVKENEALLEKNRSYLRNALQNLKCSYSCSIRTHSPLH